MSSSTLNILTTSNRLIVYESNNRFISHDPNSNTLTITKAVTNLVIPFDRVRILSVGTQGPAGVDGIDGVGGLTSVQDDPAPALGGNLIMGPYNFIGQVENDDFIIDGGLI